MTVIFSLFPVYSFDNTNPSVIPGRMEQAIAIVLFKWPRYALFLPPGYDCFTLRSEAEFHEEVHEKVHKEVHE